MGAHKPVGGGLPDVPFRPGAMLCMRVAEDVDPYKMSIYRIAMGTHKPVGAIINRPSAVVRCLHTPHASF